jgi:1,5-anhydro-D-fructose reductase (1,5-anhydro-D-mannitol-forming)
MTVSWGIIGCGNVCEVKSGPALYKCRDSQLASVMRRDHEKAADFAQRHGVRRFTNDAQAVLDDPEVNAVYVATPPGSHLDYALAAAAAGKPCYVEKPMARNATECQRMVEAFEAAGVPLFVAYYRRQLPRFLQAKQLLEEERLGTVRTVSHTSHGRATRAGQPDASPPRQGWREQVEESGGGLFLDLGSHVVDLIDFLLGPLEEVTGRARRRSRTPGRGLPEDTVTATFSTASGALGMLTHVYHAHQAMDRLEIVGDLGSLTLSVFGSEPLEWYRDDEPTQLATAHPEHVQQPLVQTIVDELLGHDSSCPSTGRSALRASLVMDRILEGYYGGRDDDFWTRPETWPGSKDSAPRSH